MALPLDPGMRILIVGAGSMGVPLGWALSGGGHHVAHHVAGGTAARMPAEFRLQVVDRRGLPGGQTPTLRPRYVEKITSRYDAIFVPIKQHEVASVLPLLHRRGGRADIVFMGDHWDDLELIEDRLPGRYLLGFQHFSGALEGDRWCGTVRRNVRLGEPGGRPSRRLNGLLDALSVAGFVPRPEPRIRDWLQTHFAVNCGFMTAAVVAGGLERLARSNEHIGLAIRLIREALAVARARGARPDLFPAETGLTTLSQWAAVLAVRGAARRSDLRSGGISWRADTTALTSCFRGVVREARRLDVSTPELDAAGPVVEALRDELAGPLAGVTEALAVPMEIEGLIAAERGRPSVAGYLTPRRSPFV